jgi:hypothetical protein
MSDDLVDRLRVSPFMLDKQSRMTARKLMCEAADEIERLRAERDALAKRIEAAVALAEERSTQHAPFISAELVLRILRGEKNDAE